MLVLIVPYPPVAHNSSTILPQRLRCFAGDCASYHWWCSSQKFDLDTNANGVSKPPQASGCTISNHTVAGGLVKFHIGYHFKPDNLTYHTL